MDHHENWHTLHNYLKDGLEKEIRLTRELLSNMHQEEVSLMLSDPGCLNQILELRSQIVEKLSSLRLFRLETTQKIEKLVVSTALEEILPPSDEISTEILSLSDQLMALTERMNRQQSQNLRMGLHPEHYRYASFQQMPDCRPQKKAAVATLNIKK